MILLALDNKYLNTTILTIIINFKFFPLTDLNRV